MKQAIAVGFTHLDLAEVYRNSASAGVAIKESGVAREALYITTKIATGLTYARTNFLKELKRVSPSCVACSCGTAS